MMSTNNNYKNSLIEEFGFGTDDTNDDSDGSEQPDTNRDLLKSVNTYSEIDKKFEDVFKDIVKTNDNFLYSSKIQHLDLESIAKELSKSVSSKRIISDDETKLKRDQNKLLNSQANSFLSNTQDYSVPHERQKLYDLYDEIPNVNHIAYRMLRVYIDNIFIKNAQTKQFVNIKENPNNIKYIESQDKNITSTCKNWLKTYMIYFDIQEKLKNTIIPNMLKYGNYFVEILDFNGLEETISNNIELIQESTNPQKVKTPSFIKEELYFKELSESVSLEHTFNLEKNDIIEENEEINNPKKAMDQFRDILSNSANSILVQENTDWMNDIFNEDAGEFKIEDIDRLDFKSMENMYLNYIHPKSVIIIEKNNIIFGYLILEDANDSQQSKEINLYERFAKAGEKKYKKGSDQDIVDKVLDDLIKKINISMEDIIKNKYNVEKDFGLSEDISKNIKLLMYERIKKKADLKFRFVSTTKMINFSGPQDKYGNYGTSIFDPIIMPVKLYTLALMSSIISRLSRASVIRKWNIEAGNRKNHAEIIDQVKKDIKNKSISFDGLSNIKNINNVLTDFRDMATIQVNGQRFIDMEIMPMHDRALPMNDMQDLRNELVTATGIPSVYLNIGDGTDLRETLVNLNTSFANTISTYQGFIEQSVSQLTNNIFKLVLSHNNYSNVQFQLTNFFKLTLNNPLILELQSNEALIGSVSNIIGLLKSSEFIVNPKQIFEMYIPQIDWDNLEKGGKDFIKAQGKQMILQNDANQQT